MKVKTLIKCLILIKCLQNVGTFSRNNFQINQTKIKNYLKSYFCAIVYCSRQKIWGVNNNFNEEVSFAFWHFEIENVPFFQIVDLIWVYILNIATSTYKFKLNIQKQLTFSITKYRNGRDTSSLKLLWTCQNFLSAKFQDDEKIIG